jgi:transcription antitermination factor NusG
MIDGPHDIAARVMTERAGAALEIGAEVDEGASWWHLVICKPDCDGLAARWLVRRRFGIFQVIAARRERVPQPDGSHRVVTVREPAFPGYIFVQLWNAPKMAERVLRTPGVEGFLCQFGDPVRIPDGFVRRLLALDWVDRSGGHVAVTGSRRQRKRRRRPGGKLHTPQDRRARKLLALDLAEAGRLAAPERISQLIKAVRGGVLPIEGESLSDDGG